MIFLRRVFEIWLVNFRANLSVFALELISRLNNPNEYPTKGEKNLINKQKFENQA